MNNSTIIGTGSYSPEFIVTNDELSKIMDTSDDWIQSRTGIRERRITKNEDTSDLAYKASINAIKNANISCEDIDLIIVATITPDMNMPSVSCLLQKKLNSINATAFDISAACSGFIYALSVADSLIKTGRYNTALVVGSEVLSKFINWNDRGTAVLFGDGAGACIVQKSNNDKSGILDFYTKSKGKDGDVLTMGTSYLSNPYVTKDEIEEKQKFIEMKGREVFKFAVQVMPESIMKILEMNNEKLEDIDWIVPHQANERIINFVSKKLEMNIEKFYMNLDKYGNTSSASIPIALDEMNKKGLLKKGHKIILVGFGGGLTFGAALIQW